jgi:hypothetical protein
MNTTFLGNPDEGKRAGFIPVVHHVIWILATPISSVGPSISNITFDIEDFDIVCLFDIDVLHLRYRISISKVFDCSISKVTNLRYPTSITGSLISRFHDFDIEGTKLGHRMVILYMISKVILTFDVEGHVIHVGFDIGYDIAPIKSKVMAKWIMMR